MSSLPLLPSFRRQQLLLDFAALKRRCPEGIYLSPSPNDPSIWSGIFFVRKGPYASACLRFEISFPMPYPDVPPSLTFSTEIFHPLLVPLTTYTFAAGALDPTATFSASDTDRLPPGAFSLRHGFPEWFRSTRERTSVRSSSTDSRRSLDGDATAQQNANTTDVPTNATGSSIISVLEYMKAAFEDSDLLDRLPLEAAGNPSAWHAWRAHRGLPKLGARSMSPIVGQPSSAAMSPARNPGDWNWDGVWEARVRNGINESVSDALLFGSKIARSTNSGTETIKFAKYDDERLGDVQKEMLRAQGFDDSLIRSE